MATTTKMMISLMLVLITTVIIGVNINEDSMVIVPLLAIGISLLLARYIGMLTGMLGFLKKSKESKMENTMQDNVNDKSTASSTGKWERIKSKAIGIIASGIAMTIMVFIMVTMLTKNPAVEIGEDYLIEKMNVSIGTKYYMIFTDPVVRVKGDYIRGTFCPIDGDFSYYLYTEKFDVLHSGNTRMLNEWTGKPGSTVKFNGGGIEGWVTLGNDEGTGRMEFKVDYNVKG